MAPEERAWLSKFTSVYYYDVKPPSKFKTKATEKRTYFSNDARRCVNLTSFNVGPMPRQHAHLSPEDAYIEAIDQMKVTDPNNDDEE